MTREPARESAKEDRRMAELKEAYADGEAIQWLTSKQNWVDLNEPNFSPPLSEYRIKPVFRYWSML